jgi:hypothetical protein
VRELALRLAGPAIVVVHELEGPTRMLLAGADGDDDALRVSEWLSASAARSAAILAALALVDAEGLARASAWHDELRGDAGRPGG